MIKKSKPQGAEELHVVKGAGFTATKKIRRDKSVNRRAGLHDKLKSTDGEVRVKRRKPLALKHVRRMRKFAAVASLGVVGALAAFGVGFFSPAEKLPLTDVGNPTVCLAPPTDGTKPTDYSLVENVGYLNYVLQNQPYWSSETKSTVQAMMGIEQGVDSYKKYYNGILIAADCSFSSLAESMQYGEQFCQAYGVVLARHSTSNKTDDLKNGMYSPWSTDPANGWTVVNFRENRGLPPLDFSVYILNEKTIANASDYSVVDNGDGTFSMTLELNVNTDDMETSADYYYRLQMRYNGDLNELPVISKTTLTYTFDANWRVLELAVDDAYRAKAMGFNSNCTSHCVTTFNYDEESAYNTFWEDYFKAEYERLKDTLSDDDVSDKEETPSAMGYLASAFGSVVTDGAIFKLDLNIDNLDLSGVVAVEMENSSFSGLSAKLGDILVWLDGETLYINDGASKYKLNINGLLSSGEEGEEGGDLLGGLNVGSLMNQMTSGTFIFNEETGVASLNSEVELFGLKIPMEFEFQKTEGGVELNFLKAEISLGDKVIKAKLCFGEESDKPSVPTDTTGYQDILNDGVTLDVALNANGFTLDGVAKIIMEKGAFTGVYADLGEMSVYYDYPHNMLYLSVGEVKYKLDISALGTGDTSAPAPLGLFDIKSLLADIIGNLTTGESYIGTSLNDIDVLDGVLKAALNVSLSLNGGLKVDAGLTLNTLDVNLTAKLSNTEVTLPDLTDYRDVLNSVITLDVSLTLLTGLADEETGKRDEVTLDGKVALCLNDGNITEIRADFGGLAVYFDFPANTLYIRVGTTKLKINLDAIGSGNASMLTASDAGFANIDLPAAVSELLTNLVGDGKIISTGLTLDVLASELPVWAKLDLTDGLSVSAGLSLLGIDAEAQVKLSTTALEGLGEEAKEEYIDVLRDGLKIIDSLIGNHISATVEGTLYSYEEKYAELNGIKYTFTAALEYDKGTVSVDEEGVETDTKAYIHLNIGLTAKHPQDDSLYLDIVLMDANPKTGTDGKTTGGYTSDGNFDVYLSVSNRLNNPVPLNIYAPVDEILTLVSMVGATAHLNGMTFEGNEELATAVGKIASLLDAMLISNYLPKSVQDKFASLGDSLIPQILGVSLEELLNSLFGSVDNTVQEAQEGNFSLSDNYVSSIKTVDNSLVFVLDSSRIYGTQIASEDNLTVSFDRVLKDNTYVGGASIENVFFGENRINKLNLGLKLNYGEITRPDATTAFKGYLNADGLDTLLNGLINSATHKVDGTEDVYDLNHYYLLQGNVTAGISVIGININAVIQIKSLAVYIDEATNKVSVDAHIYYDGVQEANQVAINGNTDVYISVRGGRISIRRIQYTYWKKSGLWTSSETYGTPVVEVREMSLKEFSDNMMDNIVFIFNFGSVITKNLENAGSSENSGVSFVGLDYGECLNTVISSYLFEETSAGASWTVALNGDLIKAYTGMTTTNIPVKFSADLNDDGSYTVKSLEILKTTMQLFGKGVTLNLTGKLTYCNPHEELGAGFVDSSCNLYDTKVTLSSEYTIPNIESSFTYACGSQIKLPIDITTRVDGYSYILDGYTQTTEIGGTANVLFEDYVEENGVRYGLVTLTGDTAYTAIWNTAYTVTFTDENGTLLYSAIYRANDVLDLGNMPACPELDGYTSQWVGADGTAANGLAVTADMSLKVEYTKTPLKVTLNSTVDFNYTGYDGTYKVLNLGFEEGADYAITDATAAGYTFVGWWYNDGGSWRKVTSVEEFVDAGSVTLEALWLKADISVTSTRDQYRKNVWSTLYYYYYFESEVTYGFEGNAGLVENITCTQTTYAMHYSNKKGSKNYPYTFEGYQGKLEQQKITLEDSWDSAKFDSWNMVVTLTFTLPDGSAWSTPQTGVFSLTGNY